MQVIRRGAEKWFAWNCVLNELTTLLHKRHENKMRERFRDFQFLLYYLIFHEHLSLSSTVSSAIVYVVKRRLLPLIWANNLVDNGDSSGHYCLMCCQETGVASGTCYQVATLLLLIIFRLPPKLEMNTCGAAEFHWDLLRAPIARQTRYWHNSKIIYLKIKLWN